MAYQTRGRDPLFDTDTALVLERRGRELAGLVLAGLGIVAALALMSYTPEDPGWFTASDGPVQNWLGRAGAAAAASVFMVMGLGAWALVAVPLVWGGRLMLHRGASRGLTCVVFAPIWIALCSVYASGLPAPPGWGHGFGMGGLFGDMAMGAVLTALPLPASLGLKLVQLGVAAVIVIFGGFVLGFTRSEVRSIARFLLLGVVMVYATSLRLLGRGALGALTLAQALQAAQAERRARRAAEAQARAAAAAAAAPSSGAVPPLPQQGGAGQASRVLRADLPGASSRGASPAPSAPPRAMTAPGPAGWQAPPPVSHAAPAAPFAPARTAAASGPAPTGPLGFLSGLMRRAEADALPEPELVDPPGPSAGVDAPAGDRLRARIADAVRRHHPGQAMLTPDPRKPLTQGRGWGPQPLILDTRPRPAAPAPAGLPPEPPLTAPPQSLPPEPPLTARREGAGPRAGLAHPPLPGAAGAGTAAPGPDLARHVAPLRGQPDRPRTAAPTPEASEAPGRGQAGAQGAMEAPRAPMMPAAQDRLPPPPATPRQGAFAEAARETGESFYDEDAILDADPLWETDEPYSPFEGEPERFAAPASEPRRVVQSGARKPLQPSRRAREEAQPSLRFDDTGPAFELPPLSLLMSPEQIERHVLSDEALEENARMLETVLDDYGVKGEIVSVRPGPVVTMYELEPAPGLKASRVIGLADDIARSMSALSARVSTVPGRSVIGIELPNDKREMVCFREILSDRSYGDGKHALPLALGKDIGGGPIVANLAKMPHLLIAGTTGSGKSVAINTMILSLLYKLTPDDLRLVMIDPKMLELSVYDGIPHLLSPVVTDPKKAVVALKWVVGEMEDRYRKMSKMGVRNIDGYNSRVEDALSRGDLFSRTVQTGFDDDTGEPVFETEEFEPKKMPYIVVIVDEMADLMMVAGKEIEACIQRLAQMARASGIHLIMATQRPSVDVITGTIKANFPTRISFQVTSKIDSRTILGEMGAEQLLGMGDMLYMAGGARITRCHGPFVSDEEVEEIVNHLKSFGAPDYVSGVVEGPDDEKSGDIDAVLGLGTGGNTTGEDALYDQAVAIVVKDRKCSTSYIQRKLGIGYNKAARLVEQMEDEGVVSPANHVGKREILVPEPS